jgi:hypothetical protein
LIKFHVEREFPFPFFKASTLNVKLERATYKVGKAGKHVRESYGKLYHHLKLVLPSKYNDLIGRYYISFRGKAEWKRNGNTVTGDCIVLLFPDDLKNIKTKTSAYL